MRPAYFNWSSGKDSAYALHRAIESKEYEIKELLVSINSSLQRVTMHGLRVSVLERQLKAIGLPYSYLELPENPTMEEYGKLMKAKVSSYKELGINHAGFGDIFLEDLKRYREEQLNAEGVNTFFPIWKENTKDLIRKFISEGFKTIVVAVNGEKLDKSFAGRVIDHQFLEDLPFDVDPCGENGEFHTFCYDGPIFQRPVEFEIGETVIKTYPSPSKKGEDVEYYFKDIL